MKDLNLQHASHVSQVGNELFLNDRLTLMCMLLSRGPRCSFFKARLHCRTRSEVIVP